MNDTYMDPGPVDDPANARQGPGGSPLDDKEQAFVYEVCRQHSARAYGLVRRLATHGLVPDLPYPDGPARSSTTRGVVWNGTYYRGSYVSFLNGHPSPSGKTKTWNVHNDGGRFLGAVRWWAAWRKYCYFPEDDTVLEQVCLREIASFVEDRTQEHKR